MVEATILHTRTVVNKRPVPVPERSLGFLIGFHWPGIVLAVLLVAAILGPFVLARVADR